MAFLSFKHGPPDEFISDRLRSELPELNVAVVRLKDAPPLAGDSLSGRIEQRVTEGVALITLWSARSIGAYWVQREREFARQQGLEECLVLFPKISLPGDWPKTPDGQADKVYEPLQGVTISRPLRSGDPPMVSFDGAAFSTMVRRIALFVHTQAALRRSRAESKS